MTVKGQSLMKEFDLNINPEEKIKDSDIDYMLENNKLLEYLKQLFLGLIIHQIMILQI